MITKVAKVQALRDAFPAQLGAMYTSEEQGIVDIEAEEITTARKTISTEVITQEEPTEEIPVTEQQTEELDFNAL